MPARDRLISPLEYLSSTVFSHHHHLQRAHVFGCPVFILDPQLQDSKKIPKLAMRSKCGIYLGISPSIHQQSILSLIWLPDPSLPNITWSLMTVSQQCSLMDNLTMLPGPIFSIMVTNSMVLFNHSHPSRLCSI